MKRMIGASYSLGTDAVAKSYLTDAVSDIVLYACSDHKDAEEIEYAVQKDSEVQKYKILLRKAVISAIDAEVGWRH